MASALPALRQAQTEAILRSVAAGNCCALYGLSNTGKSPLLRALASADNQQRFAHYANRTGALIYVDCNRVVELSATGFYEIVIRSLLEFIEDPATPPAPSPELLGLLRDYHARITTGPAFQASLAFNSALADLAARMNLSLVLLLDEFDEIYAALEDRTLLNLRALKDHARDRLAYVTATVRPLAETRVPGDNEFAELFTGCQMALGLLPPDDARRALDGLAGPLAPSAADAVERLAGGHFGLLATLSLAALRAPASAGSKALQQRLAGDLTARAECLKLWNQLRPEEQAALVSLVTAPEEGLSAADLARLRNLGLLVGDGGGHRLFSELFAALCATPGGAAGPGRPGRGGGRGRRRSVGGWRARDRADRPGIPADAAAAPAARPPDHQGHDRGSGVGRRVPRPGGRRPHRKARQPPAGQDRAGPGPPALPAYPARARLQAHQPAGRRRPRRRGRLRLAMAGEIVLVVEDDAALLDGLRDILELSEYQVLTARNGLEGLAVLKALPDLIVSDINMPQHGRLPVLLATCAPGRSG